MHEGGNRAALRSSQPVAPVEPFIYFFLEGGFCQAKRHVVAQTQVYHLVCIWESLVKSQGVGLL